VQRVGNSNRVAEVAQFQSAHTQYISLQCGTY
jgi:hypothetical protein